MYVVKVGGSLMNCAEDILRILKKYDVLIVPGGGIFADAVRKAYSELRLSERATHEMAIMAMNQYGILLSDLSGIETTENIKKIKTPCIMLPYEITKDVFEPSWDTTSDTIACYIAEEVKAERVVLLKDVDGIYIDGKLVDRVSAEELQKYGETCVDKELPKFLQKYSRECWIVNGKKLERVQKALEGKLSGTLILPE